MKSSILQFTCCILTLFLLSSCSLPQRSSHRKVDATGMPLPLEPSKDLQFEDIPVPLGFKLLVKESFSHEAKSFRIAQLKYVGSDPIEEVVAFYKEQMPLSNWKLSSIMGFGDSKTLDFEKGKEKCTVSIIEDGSRTYIEIRLR